MEVQRWEQVTTLFEASLELPRAERRRFLEERCDGDTGLLREVLGLIDEDERHDAYMEPPRATELKQATSHVGHEDLSGSQVGGYRLERVLGRGGMGAVYLGRRLGDDFEQEVAIKLIRRGMDTDDILERFQNERRVLAKLTHAGIARLIDGGATEDGRPYLVMEVVEGEPIDAYCRSEGLDVTQRLELFLAVCAATQHAHAQNVVHRDLKPSNILVTEAGEPKLLDFGIAKLVDATGSTRTVDVTATELRLMTPEYASPEQILSGKVDARSDVYALGVILYELLTGERPYQSTTGLRSDLEHAICEEDPVRPSRRVDSRQMRTRLSGDLDTIVLTAMRKEPSRRYASVEELAGDLRRHLRGLPVLARPDTWRYRCAKFVRRNRLLVGATVSVFAVLLVGLAGTLAMFLEAERERKEGRVREYVARVAAAAGALRSNDAIDARRNLEAAPDEHRGWEWRHLMARTDTSASTLADSDGTTRVAWSPGGGWLASGTRLGAVVLREGATGEPSLSWRFSGRISSLSFDPGGERLLVEVDGRGLRMLDPASSEPLWKTTAAVIRGTFGPSGRTLAAVEPKRIRILDATSGAELLVLDHPGIEYWGVGFCSERVLAFVSRRGVLGTWDLDREEVSLMNGGEPVVSSLQFIGDDAFDVHEELVALASWGGELQVWDTRTGERVRKLDAHGERIACVDFDPAGERIATASQDRSIRVWDVDSGVLLETLLGHGSRVNAVAFHPTRERLVSGGEGGPAKLWNLPSSSSYQRDHGYRMGLALSPDGDRIAVSAWESWGGVRAGVDCWSLLENGPAWRTLYEIPERVTNGGDLVWSPDGARVFASHGGVELHVLDAASGEEVDTWTLGPGPLTLAFSADGSRLAAGRETIWILDPADGRVLTSFPLGGEGYILSMAYGFDGALLLTSGWGKAARVHRVSDGRVLTEIAESDQTSIAGFSPDGTRFVTGSTGNQLQVWSTRDFSLVAVLEGHTSTPRDASFSPDGKRLVSCGFDRTIRVWDPETGRELATLHGHASVVDEVEFSRDGSRLVSQDRVGVVKIWDAPPP